MAVSAVSSTCRMGAKEPYKSILDLDSQLAFLPQNLLIFMLRI